MDSKYRMFKNYMYNDLGITKEDIKEWTKEAVKEVSANYLDNHVPEWDIKTWVRNGLDNVLQKITLDYLKNVLNQKYEVKIIERETK